MAQALLHRQQHIGVAACLDMDNPVWMQAGQVQRRREQVAPSQAPEDRPLDPGEDAGEEDRCRRVVAKLGAARNFVKRARREAASRQVPVDRRDAERRSSASPPDAFDGGDAGTQVGNDSGLPHGVPRLGAK